MSYPGKIANNILVKRVFAVDEKIKQGRDVTENEMKDVRFFAEKHRSTREYFIHRTEVQITTPEDIEALLDKLERENNQNVDDVAENLEKQLKNNNDVAENARTVLEPQTAIT